jgi:hypothetical protein
VCEVQDEKKAQDSRSAVKAEEQEENKVSESRQRGSSGVDSPGRPGVSMIRKVSWTVGNWGSELTNEIVSVRLGTGGCRSAICRSSGTLASLRNSAQVQFLSAEDSSRWSGIAKAKSNMGRKGLALEAPSDWSPLC